MITISLCMIVKNNEKTLNACLSSIQSAVDEIIIVDMGSSDKTIEIAQKYTDRIYFKPYKGDLSEIRNFSYEKAEMEYQMWLEPYDIIRREDLSKLLELKKTLNKNIDIVSMPYVTHVDKNKLPVMTIQRERLTKVNRTYHWNDPINEYITIYGNIFYSDVTIYNNKKDKNPDSKLKFYDDMERNNQKFSPRQLYYYGRELAEHKQYKKAIEYLNRFLDNGLGWSEFNIASCYFLSTCYREVKDNNKILETLIKSFEYDSPRAEICCEIAYYYKERCDYKKAKDWFLIAFGLEKPHYISFMLNEYWDYIPAKELSSCYLYLSDVEKSKEFQQVAEQLKPMNKDKYA